MSTATQELIDKGEVRIAGVGEILWIRLRIVTLAAGVGAGALWGTWICLRDPVSWWTFALVTSLGLSAIGMNVAYHPYFAHGAFRTGRGFKIFLAVWGATVLRGPVINWVAHHRRHHKYTDLRDQDPHTPMQFGGGLTGVLAGLWWVFLGEKLTRVRTINAAFARDLLEDPDLVAVNRVYDVLALCTVLGPGAVAWAITGDADVALTATCVLGCLRGALAYGMIAVVVNGLCHLVGTAPFRPRDSARNLAIFSLPTFGGSLHHNHHVFPKSLTVALDGELDPFDVLYWGLEKSGLIWDVYRPSPARIARARAGDLEDLGGSPEPRPTP